MTLVVFLGEGDGDVGNSDPSDGSPTDEYPGDLVAVTRRVLADLGATNPDAFRHQPLRWKDVRTRGTRRTAYGEPRGLAAKLLRALQHPPADADALVAVVDGDDDPDGRMKELQLGRRRAEEQNVALALRCAVGVAVREMEAWLLADPYARQFGLGAWAAAENLSADPEDLADPKREFRDLHSRARSLDSGVPADRPTVKAAIIGAMRSEYVARRCPRGFRPFRREVQDRLLPLFGPAESGSGRALPSRRKGAARRD